MPNLTPNFTLEEMTASSTAIRRGIDNTPDAETTDNLVKLCEMLEKVRAILCAPMIIDSGYRCPALNWAIGGVSNSAHVKGYAADFIAPQFGSPLDIVNRIKDDSTIQYDQLIQEGTWVHLSVAPTMRREVLTAHFSAGGATYTQGA